MYDELLEMIESNKLRPVKQILVEMHESDIAEILEHIENPASLVKVFKLLPKDMGAQVFSYVDTDIQEKLITALSSSELGPIIEEMYIDDAVDLVEEMPANMVEKILRASTPETRSTINKFLKYEDSTAGSIMTPEFVDVKDSMSVGDSIKRVKKLAENVETINVVYVTDGARVIKGVVSIRDLILANDNKKISDIMNDNVIYAETDTDQEEIARMFSEYDFLAMPIVDKEKRLVGIVTVDDVIDVIEEEASEDISVMAGVTPNEKPYLKTSVFRIWLNRFPWLMLLMISATFTGLIISKNETLLNNGIFGILLTSCIPMIMDTGGNAGGQASATIVRGIALGDVEFRDLFKVMLKEFLVSLLVGLSLAVVCFGKILLVDGVIFGTEGVKVGSAAIIASAMFFTIVIAKIVGCSLPLIAKKLKFDPAVMASPFITTIVDILSLLVYCFLATTFLM